MSGADAPRGRLTYADYAALPDDGKRYQLVEGELLVTPSPNTPHQLVLGHLYACLLEHAHRHRLGRVFLAPLDVVLEDHTVLQPDVLFVSNERMSIVTRANIAGAPDLCVEILSPGTARFDRARKRSLYARFGVAHYWIVDPDARSIEEHVLEAGGYALRSQCAGHDEFRPALFPGFTLSLGAADL